MSTIEQARDAAEKISGRLQCQCSECLDSVAKSFMAFHSDMISKAAPSTPTVEEIMQAIQDGALAGGLHLGMKSNSMIEIHSRIFKLLQQKGQAPSSKGEDKK